jgi:hypothetical protein
VDDARNYPYRIRCAKFVRILETFEKCGKPDDSRAGAMDHDGGREIGGFGLPGQTVMVGRPFAGQAVRASR